MASIRKRRWASGGEERTAWVVAYSDQQGKRRHRTFKTRKAADAWLVEARHEIAHGLHTPRNEGLTISRAAELWYRDRELKGREYSTLRAYRLHIDRYITPVIGNIPLVKFTDTDAIAFMHHLLEHGPSKHTARGVLKSLKSLVRFAPGNAAADNALRKVSIDADKRSNNDERKFITKEDLRTLLGKLDEFAGAQPSRWQRNRALIYTAVFTGLRASELRGLRWQDVDLTTFVVHVRQRADERRTLGPPKSAAGRRAVPIPPIVVNILKEWRLACPKGPEDLVFPNGVGRVELYSNIHGRVWGRLQRECWGEKRYRFHSLRHTAASLFIEAGYSAKKVQTLIGHASISTTFNIYGHLYPSDEEDQLRAARIAESVLFDAG